MKTTLKITITAGLLAFFAQTQAQEKDTTKYDESYHSERTYDDQNSDDERANNTYNMDTTGYNDEYDPNQDVRREQQGGDTYNDTQNETEYSNDNDTNQYNEDTSSGDREGSTLKQEEIDRNKDIKHTNDGRYKDEQSTEAGIKSGAIAPARDSVHRQVREELSHATDTLDYESSRNANPEKAGNKVEHMADSVISNQRDKDKEKHGID